jgi:hypothetical protein
MLFAAFGVAAAIPILLLVACPLIMFLMMRGHGGHHAGRPNQPEQMTLAELEAERDALNAEIGQRASPTPRADTVPPRPEAGRGR